MKKLLFLPVYYGLMSIIIPFTTSFAVKAPAESTDFLFTSNVSVLNHLSGEEETMSFDDYLIGVVSAEMPASFEPEALKAQAVAARTYTLYKSSSNDHTADVCTDSSHCQAYITKEEMLKNWQEDYDLYYNKIKDAVCSTKGEYISYNNEPAMAVFHSMGGGKTENSFDVWGSSVPYLISVDSPGEEAGVNYQSTLKVPFDEFKATISSHYPSSVINSFSDISQPVLTQGGHVKTIVIGSVSVPGTAMRKLFNLRSTKFTISFENSNVVFNVVGYGHGVGMSQYGANAMSKNGKNYKEILAHYYPGTSIASCMYK